MIKGASDSLAGRIGYVELTPLLRTEIEDASAREFHWLRGEYPGSLLASSDSASEDWRANYLEAYITKELPRLGTSGNVGALRRLFSMLAGQESELVNRANYARALGVSEPTVRTYLDLLEQSFLIRLLPPYHQNTKKRLVKAPKSYIRDTGLLHLQAGIETEGQLRSSIIGGASWEGYVIEQIAGIVSNYARLYFYRTHTGAEMDLVIVGRRGKIACVEIKLSSAPTLTKGFHVAREDIGPERTIVVASVKTRFALAQGIEVMSLDDALGELQGW